VGASPASVTRPKVHHGVFEDLVGGADQFRHVEPFEAPILADRVEVGEFAGLVPAVLLIGVAFDLRHPIDELVARPVDIIDDGVDHHLAGQDRAGAGIGLAGAGCACGR
jgi:hypothetical protein